MNCKGPEEVIPGQVQDSLDLTVYERPTGGTYPMLVHNHIGDGTTKQFTIGNNLVQDAGIFVKINNVIISHKYTCLRGPGIDNDLSHRMSRNSINGVWVNCMLRIFQCIS